MSKADTDPILAIEKLAFSYRDKTVLSDIQLALHPGHILALLGPNGAGKSTLIRCICGRLRPDAGRLRVADADPMRSRTARAAIGLAPQQIALYPHLTVTENLTAFARLAGVKRKAVAETVAETVEFCDLGAVARRPVGVLSGGWQRRVNIGCAMSHSPRLLILDEPTVGIDPPAREEIERLLQRLAATGLEDETGEETTQDGLVAQRLLGGGRQIDDGVSYYAGAVAILFLLFAAMQGAISLIDERNSGIVDRLVSGPGGYTVVVVGKGLFLTLQGLVQAGLIFAVAWWMYGIDWIGRFGPWLVTAFLAAAVSAWLGLLLASLCRTRQQAQTASAFVVLILSAIGGSMMPRFLMPGWLRELGWFTPNAWVIESWHGIFWRGDGPVELAQGWVVLLATALVAMAISVWLAHRLAMEK